MADENTLNYLLDEITRHLPNFTDSEETRDDFLERMLRVVLEHLDAETVAQVALPGHNVHELIHGDHNDTQQLNEEHPDGDQGNIDITNNQLGLWPLHLRHFAEEGIRKIFVTDLSIEQGTLSDIQYIVLDVEGFKRRFSIPGGYSQSIDRHMRTKAIKNLEGKRYTDTHIQTHRELRFYFARVFSFVPEHKLNDARRYDIAVKSEANKYVLHADTREVYLLGSAETVHSKQIHLAVQQGSTVFGFHLRDNIEDRVTCTTVVEERRVATTTLNPRKEAKVEISPHVINTLNLDHVFVTRPIKSFSRSRKKQCVSGNAGRLSSDSCKPRW